MSFIEDLNRKKWENELMKIDEYYSASMVSRWKNAAEKLAEINDRRSIPILISAVLYNFNDDKLIESNQNNILMVLKKIDKENTYVDLLITNLNPDGRGKSREAAKALGIIKDKKAIEPLITFIKKCDDQVIGSWSEAIIALKNIGGPVVLKALEKLRLGYLGRKEEAVELAIKKLKGIKDEEVPETPISIAIKTIIEIYKKNPQGFVSGSRSMEAKKIREIGKMLYDNGGFELMQQVHSIFSQTCSIYGAARNLEHLWDGIGGWQG